MDEKSENVDIVETTETGNAKNIEMAEEMESSDMDKIYETTVVPQKMGLSEQPDRSEIGQQTEVENFELSNSVKSDNIEIDTKMEISEMASKSEITENFKKVEEMRRAPIAPCESSTGYSSTSNRIRRPGIAGGRRVADSQNPPADRLLRRLTAVLRLENRDPVTRLPRPSVVYSRLTRSHSKGRTAHGS